MSSWPEFEITWAWNSNRQRMGDNKSWSSSDTYHIGRCVSVREKCLDYLVAVVPAMRSPRFRQGKKGGEGGKNDRQDSTPLGLFLRYRRRSCASASASAVAPMMNCMCMRFLPFMFHIRYKAAASCSVPVSASCEDTQSWQTLYVGRRMLCRTWPSTRRLIALCNKTVLCRDSHLRKYAYMSAMVFVKD